MVGIEGVDLDTVEGRLQPVHSGAPQQKFRKLFISRQVVSEAFDRKIGGMCPTGSLEVVRAKKTRKTQEKGPPRKERKDCLRVIPRFLLHSIAHATLFHPLWF